MAYEIKSPKVWFVQTIEERNEIGIPRLRLLPGQWVNVDGNWESGDINLNIQSDSPPRTTNPVGTIFAVTTMNIQNTKTGKPYYSVKPAKLINLDKPVTPEMDDAYSSYRDIMIGKKPEKEEPIAKTPGVESLLEKMIKKHPVPTIKDDQFYVDEEIWMQMLFNLAQGYNTMLVGESGSGKTELAQLLAKKIGWSCKVLDMAAKQDPTASLIGTHRFDGKSTFDRADFTYEIEKEKNIVILDELPRAPLNSNNILFPVLDSRRELNMDIAFHGARAIKVHEKCRFIGTANEGYEYTGNNILDRALKERFQFIQIGFPPDSVEVDLLKLRKKADKKDASTIVKVAQKIRNQHNQEELTGSVSVRHTLYAADLVANGFTLAKAMELAFLPLFATEEERMSVKDILASR